MDNTTAYPATLPTEQPAQTFRAEGGAVWTNPIHRPDGKGGARITLGFKVCNLTPEAGEEAAATVAELMTAGARALAAKPPASADPAEGIASARAAEKVLARAATEPAPERAPGEPLWCVHIVGPDELYPAPDAETAVTWANAVNALSARGNRGCTGDDFVLMHANVRGWPGPVEEHARLLPAAIADMMPRTRIAEAAAGAHPDGGWKTIVADAQRMAAWVTDRFGRDSLINACERADRVLEEATEVHQAVYAAEGRAVDGLIRAERLTQHVYSKEAGAPAQEIGGLMTCALALGVRLGVRIDRAARAEIDRIEGLSKAHFDKRHQAKVEAGVAAQHDRPAAA